MKERESSPKKIPGLGTYVCGNGHYSARVPIRVGDKLYCSQECRNACERDSEEEKPEAKPEPMCEECAWHGCAGKDGNCGCACHIPWPKVGERVSPSTPQPNLHGVICDAVVLLNRGDDLNALKLLRQSLVSYADFEVGHPEGEDLEREAREWWIEHQDDFVSEIRGAGLDTHSLYDIPSALTTFVREREKR